MHEFEIINHFFAQHKKNRQDVILGIGDDAALLKTNPDQLLATSVDTLVAGIHFPENTSPQDIAYKALAVNLSDLAAMGVTPAWATLALTLPNNNEDWLKAFSEGFFSLLDQYQMQLIGGDTTRGPLTITVQVTGFVTEQNALRRDQAQAGDLIYVTGTLGDAGLGLQLCQHPEKYNINGADKNYLLQRLHRPDPRVTAGLALQQISHCAIDISDGLAADLQHILTASKVGASLNVDQLPLSAALKNNVSIEQAYQLALNSGDDYELCFTVAAEKAELLKTAFAKLNCEYTCIGKVEQQVGLRLQYADGRKYEIKVQGYQHF